MQKKAFLSQFIYIIIGLAGLPVFSLGGGIQYVFKNTFGYIIGFMVCAFIIGLGVDNLRNTFRTILAYLLWDMGLHIS